MKLLANSLCEVLQVDNRGAGRPDYKLWYENSTLTVYKSLYLNNPNLEPFPTGHRGGVNVYNRVTYFFSKISYIIQAATVKACRDTNK